MNCASSWLRPWFSSWRLCLLALGILAGCDRVQELAHDAREKVRSKADQTKERVRDRAITTVRTMTEGHHEPLVRELTRDSLPEFLRLHDRVLLIDFHADWCAPCKQLSPVLEEVVASYEGKVLLGTVDVDAFPELAKRYGISAIPDVRFFRNGVLTEQFTGAIPAKQIRRLLDAELAQLSSAVEPSLIDKLRKRGERGDDSPDSDHARGRGEGEGLDLQPMRKDWLPPGVERQ